VVITITSCFVVNSEVNDHSLFMQVSNQVRPVTQYYYKSKKIKQKFDSGVNGFQVLIVTPGQIEEDNNLRGRIANIYNEITVNSNIYPTKSLFLLTTPLKLSLSDPKSVFLAIWVSVKIIKYLLSLLE